MTDTAPLPLTDRIIIALDQVRVDRDKGDVSCEWSWTVILDRLLDRYAPGLSMT